MSNRLFGREKNVDIWCWHAYTTHTHISHMWEQWPKLYFQFSFLFAQQQQQNETVSQSNAWNSTLETWPKSGSIRHNFRLLMLSYAFGITLTINGCIDNPIRKCVSHNTHRSNYMNVIFLDKLSNRKKAATRKEKLMKKEIGRTQHTCMFVPRVAISVIDKTKSLYWLVFSSKNTRKSLIFYLWRILHRFHSLFTVSYKLFKIIHFNLAPWWCTAKFPSVDIGIYLTWIFYSISLRYALYETGVWMCLKWNAMRSWKSSAFKFFYEYLRAKCCSSGEKLTWTVRTTLCHICKVWCKSWQLSPSSLKFIRNRCERFSA